MRKPQWPISFYLFLPLRNLVNSPELTKDCSLCIRALTNYIYQLYILCARVRYTIIYIISRFADFIQILAFLQMNISANLAKNLLRK